MEKDKKIRQLSYEELEEALALVWEVFSSEIAPLCTDEGIDDFWASIEYEYLLHRMGDGFVRFWGAFDGDSLIAVCAMRQLSHVLLLFVKPEYQGQGAGTNLLKQAVIDCKEADSSIESITVEAFEGAAAFFGKMGFALSGQAADAGGLRLLPMTLGKNARG